MCTVLNPSPAAMLLGFHFSSEGRAACPEGLVTVGYVHLLLPTASFVYPGRPQQCCPSVSGHELPCAQSNVKARDTRAWTHCQETSRLRRGLVTVDYVHQLLSTASFVYPGRPQQCSPSVSGHDLPCAQSNVKAKDIRAWAHCQETKKGKPNQPNPK